VRLHLGLRRCRIGMQNGDRVYRGASYQQALLTETELSTTIVHGDDDVQVYCDTVGTNR
jgi:hypothetical protein